MWIEKNKMRSIILSTATRYLMPLLLIFSIFLLLRGHNEIGGGFVSGLVAAASITLYTIAHDVTAARQLILIDPRTLIGLGLLTALVSGLLPVISGSPFLTGIWLQNPLPVLGKVGTPLLFDIGVYLVVIGMALLIIFTLAEE